MFRPFRAKRNGIDNLERNGLSAPHYNVLYRECDVMMNLMASKMTSIGTWRKAHTPPKGNGHSSCYALISIFHLFFQFSLIFLKFVFSRFGTLPSFQFSPLIFKISLIQSYIFLIDFLYLFLQFHPLTLSQLGIELYNLFPFILPFYEVITISNKLSNIGLMINYVIIYFLIFTLIRNGFGKKNQSY